MRIGIIGGGPAGMMAAVSAAEKLHAGSGIVLFEKNKMLGRKLRITGKGRCNVTNDCDCAEFIENVVTNASFLYSAIYSFTPQMTIDFFESLGVMLKTERGRRVFPESDSAKDIADAMKRAVFKSKAEVEQENVVMVSKTADGSFEVITESKTVSVDRLIIATGGKSYPLTGSTGDGYMFAKSLGHSVAEQRPALVPIEVMEKWVSELAGLSLKNVRLDCVDMRTGKKLYSRMGEMLFTHTGVSGPIVLSLSSFIKNESLDGLKLIIDLKPALDDTVLDRRLIRDFDENKNKSLENTLRALLPKSLIPIVLMKAELSPELKVNQVTQEQRQRIAKTVKGFDMTPLKLGSFDEAVVTSGGVSVREINPKTMESKLVPGLYFAGEVIDVDALTGGFNLQIAFSTGYLAGRSAANL